MEGDDEHDKSDKKGDEEPKESQTMKRDEEPETSDRGSSGPPDPPKSIMKDPTEPNSDQTKDVGWRDRPNVGIHEPLADIREYTPSPSLDRRHTSPGALGGPHTLPSIGRRISFSDTPRPDNTIAAASRSRSPPPNRRRHSYASSEWGTPDMSSAHIADEELASSSSSSSSPEEEEPEEENNEDEEDEPLPASGPWATMDADAAPRRSRPIDIPQPPAAARPRGRSNIAREPRIRDDDPLPPRLPHSENLPTDVAEAHLSHPNVTRYIPLFPRPRGYSRFREELSPPSATSGERRRLLEEAGDNMDEVTQAAAEENVEARDHELQRDEALERHGSRSLPVQFERSGDGMESSPKPKIRRWNTL